MALLSGRTGHLLAIVCGLALWLAVVASASAFVVS